MAETPDERATIGSALAEIHNTLVAASTKMAQVQLDATDDAETADTVATAMNDLGPILESVESLHQKYLMETNRIQNES